MEDLFNSPAWKEARERYRRRTEIPNDRELTPTQRVTLKHLGYKHFGAIAPLLCAEKDVESLRVLIEVKAATEAAQTALQKDTFDKLAHRELAALTVWRNAIRYKARRLVAATEYAAWDTRMEYSLLLRRCPRREKSRHHS